MYIAIINQDTNKVENVVVPPDGANAFFVSIGYYGVETDTGGIGDEFDQDTQEFIKPVVPEPVPPEEPEGGE